ncbi:MAG: flavin reductase family protein [Alphaproteobacteria bacterium]
MATLAGAESSSDTGRDAFLAVERGAFIEAMRHAAACVAVVTTDGPAGRLGITVCAMSSVSADPPSVFVCVNNASRAAEAIAVNRRFCVNLLAHHQTELSDVFAGRSGRADRFAGFAWSALGTGAPSLEDALSSFDCRLVERHVFGSHTVFMGLVVAVRSGEGAPLVYHDRAYCRPMAVA